MATPCTRTPNPGVMTFIILLDSSLVILGHIMPVPLHKNPCPGVMKYTILVDPSLVIINIYLVCLM